MSRHICISPSAYARALALAFTCLPASAFAQSAGPFLDPVTVTSSRFQSGDSFPAIGASVITAREIREAGAVSVADALRRVGGIPSRNTGAAEPSFDLRGFANANADNNTVIMVDGVRLSENEQAAALLSSLPIESVERIEIMRGGSSVLYGEGATGGVIRVVTKRDRENRSWGTAVAGIGSFHSRDLRISTGRDWDGLSLDASLQSQRADGWRENSDNRQQSFTATMQYRLRDGRLGLRVDRTDQDTRFPGPMNREQFEANPRQALDKNDFGAVGLTRYTLFGERRFGQWEAAFDLSQREKTARSNFVSFGSDQTDRSRVFQLSPRLRHSARHGTALNELTLGVDYQQWSRFTNRISTGMPSAAVADQESLGFYLRDELHLGAWRLAAGARQERFEKNFRDPLATFGSTAWRVTHPLRAWDLEAALTVRKGLQVYGKAGQSYRVPNSDDNASTVTTNQPLLPQTSRDLELGMDVGGPRQKLVARVFQHSLRNEIMNNPDAGFGANVNVPATRRQGVELEGRVGLPASFVFSANLQFIRARITEGADAGKALVLVPSQSGSMRLNWLPSGPHSASAGIVWVGPQRFSGDFSNSCSARVPGHAMLDARYAWKHQGWEVALLGTNLTDRPYYSNGFSFSGCQYRVYPDNGRALKLTVRRDF